MDVGLALRGQAAQQQPLGQTQRGDGQAADQPAGRATPTIRPAAASSARTGCAAAVSGSPAYGEPGRSAPSSACAMARRRGSSSAGQMSTSQGRTARLATPSASSSTSRRDMRSRSDASPSLARGDMTRVMVPEAALLAACRCAPGARCRARRVAGHARSRAADAGGLLLLAIAPLAALPWLLSYWPSVDGPNHLALVHILRRLGEPGNPFEPYLQSELRVGSYSLYYWLMLGLGRLMDLHLADRLVQTAIIAGLPLSVLYLIRRIAPERRHNALAIVPLATGWLVMLGFVNFLLGFLLGLLALGAVWGRRGGRVDPVAPPSWRARAAAGARCCWRPSRTRSRSS